MLSPEFLGIGGGSSSYRVANSLRFRASNSAYLSRTPAGAGNRKTWTWSAWVKRGALSGATSMNLFGANRSGTTDATYTTITWTPSNQLATGGYATNWRITNAVFRDPSAWYHVVVAFDTTQATAGDRVKVYVNGSQITSFNTSNDPALNADLGINQAALHSLAQDVSGGPTFFDGHMAHVHFIDGQQLTPASFGKTDATTGEWVPIRYSGTYGTNGFRLAFEDATTTTTIGNDSSGNGNNWTSSGISVTAGVTFDQSLDTPTLNYCALNSVDQVGGTNTITAGLDITTSAGAISAALGTIYVSTGKWYWEFTVNGVGGSPQLGIAKAPVGTISTNGPGQSANAYVYASSGSKGNNNSFTAYGATFTTNDVIGVALDLDAGTIVFYKNNVSQGTAFSGLTGEFSAIVGDAGAATTISGSINFGQRAFAYSPPSGFVALNTANLPAPSIKRSRQYFDARLRTGTGAAASVSDLEFSPDLVWIKSRSAATNHNLFDSGRGVQKGLGTNWSGAEYSDANTLTALNSNGYSLGSDASSRGVNVSAATYVDWAWKKGSTPGFDVVTFTGNATNRTIAHGLGVVPEMMMIRTRGAPTGSEPFVVYHSKLNGGTTPANYYLYSTSTAAEAATAIFFNNTMPTSSVFTVGTDSFVNQSGTGIVAYLFAGVEGFSKFGSYVGNGSTDGPFVWCGFRPRFIMLKDRSNVAYWVMIDTVRNTFNVVADELLANTANAENGLAITTAIDVTANGFKIRTSDANLNQSSDNYIFAAFADVPFKYSRAR
jgi:hypothetical protein